VIVVAALAAGTVVAIAVTQSYRKEGTVISDLRTRKGKCPGFERRGPGIPISFFLNRDDTVSLAIVNAEDRGLRRVLLTRKRLQGDRRHCVRWDRRDNDGRPVPPGFYRLRVTLENADRVATAGEPIEVPERGG
jgi:hypothetical protein